MPKLVDLQIDEGSLVDKGANPLARVVLFKRDVEKAVWTAAKINDLPDSSFGYISPGGTKDASGKTTPRSLRHLPYKDASGKVDLPHLRNALSRLPQTAISAEAKASAKTKLEAAARSSGVATSKAGGEAMETVMSHMKAAMAAIKSLMKGKEASMGKLSDEVRKDLPDEVTTYLTEIEKKAEEAGKQAEEVTKLQAEVEALKKGTEAKPEPEDIWKGVNPAIKAEMETLKKQAKDAEEVAKAEREARLTREYLDKAKDFANVGPVEDIAKLLRTADSADPEAGKKLAETLKVANERIKLTGEIGKAGRVDDGPMAEIEKKARDLEVKENISYESAYTKILKSREGAELYRRAREEGQVN